MIYRRYGAGANEILEMPVPLFLDMFEFARKKEIEDKLYQRWLIGGHCHEQSFEEFKAELVTAANPKKPEEVYRTVEDIIEKMRKGGAADGDF